MAKEKTQETPQEVMPPTPATPTPASEPKPKAKGADTWEDSIDARLNRIEATLAANAEEIRTVIRKLPRFLF